MSFTQAFEQEITNLEELFKQRWETILPIAEGDAQMMPYLKGWKFKIEFECGMTRKFLKEMDYTNALTNFGLAERNYGVFFHEAQRLWQSSRQSTQFGVETCDR
jgi:hypothetical protein